MKLSYTNAHSRSRSNVCLLSWSAKYWVRQICIEIKGMRLFVDLIQ